MYTKSMILSMFLKNIIINHMFSAAGAKSIQDYTQIKVSLEIKQRGPILSADAPLPPKKNYKQNNVQKTEDMCIHFGRYFDCRY